MSITDALILIAFGIILPTWDVASDIAFSHSFLSIKPCDMQYAYSHYIINHDKRTLTNKDTGSEIRPSSAAFGNLIYKIYLIQFCMK